MRKSLILTLALLSGCAQVNAARDWLIDPKTKEAASITLSLAKSGAIYVSCAVGAGSSIALAVEQQAQTKGQYATGIILAASSNVCMALGGTLDGTRIATSGEPVVTAVK